MDFVEIIHLLQQPMHPYTDLVTTCRKILINLGSPAVQHNFKQANGVPDRLSRLSSQLTMTNSHNVCPLHLTKLKHSLNWIKIELYIVI